MTGWTIDDYPERFDEMPRDAQVVLLDWIDSNLLSKEGFNDKHTSYGMKQHCDPYVTNGQFKGAMLKLGYRVQDREKLNWVFNVSQKSPLFHSKMVL